MKKSVLFKLAAYAMAIAAAASISAPGLTSSVSIAEATPTSFPGGALTYVDTSVYNPGPGNMDGLTAGYVAVRPDVPAIYRTVFDAGWSSSDVTPTQVSQVLSICQHQFPGVYAALSMDYYRWGGAHRSHIAIPEGPWRTYYCLRPPASSETLGPREGDMGAMAYWYGKVNQHWATSSSGGHWVSDPNGTSGGNLDTLAQCRRWYPGANSVYHLGNSVIQHWHNRGNRLDFTGVGMVYVCNPNPFPEAPHNHAPVATGQSVTTLMGAPVALVLNGSDIDGDLLSFTIQSSPSHGIASPTTTAGAMTYTPEAGYIGSDSFTFVASDGQATSAPATVSIEVLPASGGNGAPIAEPVSASTDEDTPTVVTMVATDPDSDPLTFSIVTLPVHGSLGIVVGNTVTYTPDLNYFGPDSFSFAAHDASSTSNVVSAMVAVNPVNDAPEAFAAEATTTMNRRISIEVLGYDVEGDALTYSLASQPEHGSSTVENAADGTLSYTPDPAFIGLDTFTFVVSDGQATSAPATVSVDVVFDPGGEGGDNLPPTLDDVHATTTEGTPLLLTLVGNDPDGDSLTYGLVSGPSHGTTTVDALGHVVYTPEPDFSGSDSFTVEAFDGWVSTTPATVTVQVTPVDDSPSEFPAPTATPPPGTYPSNQLVTLAAPSSTSIRYTTTGEAPTCEFGTIYSEPIEVSTVTLRAIACYDGGASEVVDLPYVITTPPPPTGGGGGGGGNGGGGGGGSGGGGGGGGSPFIAGNPDPSTVGIAIAEGSQTNSQNVTVLLTYGPDITMVAISNTEDFASTSFVPAVHSLPWTLTPGEGLKWVYGRFRNVAGGTVTKRVSITLVGAPAGRVAGAEDKVCRTPEIEKALATKPDQALITRLKGRILLQVESCGEAWYLDPVSRKRYFLQPGTQAYIALHQFGLGVSDELAARLPMSKIDSYVEPDADGDGLSDKTEEALHTDPTKADTDGDGYSDGLEILNGYNPHGPGKLTYDPKFLAEVLGRIILQVHNQGEAWYVYPVNSKRYYMHNGTSAYNIMKYLSLGVSNADLAKIPVGDLNVSKVAPGDLDKVPTGGRD